MNRFIGLIQFGLENPSLLSAVDKSFNWTGIYRWRFKKIQHRAPKNVIRKLSMFMTFSINVRVLQNRFLAFPRGPGGFRELWGAGRNHFHLSWYSPVPGITSYDQKPWGDCFYRPRYVQKPCAEFIGVDMSSYGLTISLDSFTLKFPDSWWNPWNL